MTKHAASVAGAGQIGTVRDIAIVGMACVFPGAKDLPAYWQNIADKISAVGEPPPDWEAELYVDPAVEAEDRIYCARGGYLGALAEFQPNKYGVMPSAVDGGEPDHFLALRAAHEALTDAGYPQRAPDPERVEVIIGRGSYVNRGNTTAIQHGVVVDQVLRILKQLHPEHSSEELARVRRELKASLPPFHAETAPALVPNIISGRISNRLDFMGANYIVDAACASSLVAVDLGMRDLLSGRCDLAVVGGVHASTPPPIVMIFCQLKAIARSGEIRPFDQRADGTLLGEGVGMLVLKRRADAERDGDRIYALIKGVGVASDGRALGLLAPRVEGEVLALRRAYEAAGVAPSTVGLIEAHGTATPAGDVAEIEALQRVFGSRGARGPAVALGSVKSMISHLMPASGIAGMIKVALALHQKVLPATLNCEQPNPKLGLDDSPFYLNTDTRPWIHGAAEDPRRAGVNAFGFGGINAHAILEEYVGEASHAPPSFHRHWDSEVLIFSADSRPELIGETERLARALDQAGDISLRNLAYTLNVTRELKTWRLAVVACSVQDLTHKLTGALARLKDDRCKRIRDIAGIYFFEQPLAGEGKLAFVFPGEGSQYRNMLADLCLHFPEVREYFDLMDRAFAEHARGFLPSEVIFPRPETGEPDRHQETDALWRMDAGAEAVFAANQALHALLCQLDIRPQAMLGHSTGEHSALLAAGAVRMRDEAALIAHIRGVNAVYQQSKSQGLISDAVLMAAGGAEPSVLHALVARSSGALHIAMDNCPHQIILCGSAAAVAAAKIELEARRVICQTLPFGRPYHTPWFEFFCQPLREHLDRVDVVAPELDLYSCVTAQRLAPDPDEIRRLVASQWARPVRFSETIQAMYRDGVRIFVEVGPRGNLTGFINDILRGKPYVAIPTNVQHHSGITQLHHLLGQLTAHGVAVRLEHLYARRAPEALNLGALPQHALSPAIRAPRLATGLQPLRLPQGFTLGSKDSAAHGRELPSAASAGAAADQDRSTPAAEGRTERTRVMQAHLRTMEQFLALQAQVTSQYLQMREKPGVPKAQKAVPRRHPGPAEAAGARIPDFPFLGAVAEFVPGRKLVAMRRLALSEDILFLDHTLGRDISSADPSLLALPVVPLTITLEMLAQAGAVLYPGKVLAGMRNVRAYRWITLEHPVTLQVTALANRGGCADAEVSVREVLADQSAGPVLAEATMIFADRYTPQDELASSFALQAEQRSNWTPAQLYREGMFHGPRFRGVKSMDRCGSDGATATLRVLPRHDLFRDRREPLFMTDPVLLDAAGQVVAFWGMERLEQGVDVFPYRVEALHLAGPPPAPGALMECRVRARKMGDTQLSSDIDILDVTGKLWCRLEGWEDRRFFLPREFIQLRTEPRTAYLSVPWGAPLAACGRDDGALCSRLEGYPPEFFEAHAGIWLKVLAHLVLSRRERTLWRDLDSAVLKRRRGWLLGRCAAKDAVRRLLCIQFAEEFSPADIEILPDARGRPRVDGHWKTRLNVSPVISISHSNGLVVALAALDSQILAGIDIECLSQTRAAFETAAFTPAERDILLDLRADLKPEWYLRFWCAKEAAGKALGRGLAGGLHALRVTRAQLDTGEIQLELGHGLRTEFPELNGDALVTHTLRDGDYVASAILQPLRDPS